MQDLNELAYFVKVVDHGGFGAAARALGMQKSKLSRRVAGLEERLGVRLLQRSTRRFAVTEIGRTYYQHCQAMLVEAEAAQQAIEEASAEPRGVVRVACPPGLLAYRMSQSLAEFLVRLPKVEMRLEAVDRPVDVITEGYDLVVTTQAPEVETASVAMRKLGEMSQCLVAAPELLRTLPGLPTELRTVAGVASGVGEAEWVLTHEEGLVARVPFPARLVTEDLSARRAAAVAGIGVAQMPELMIEEDLATGRLQRLLPRWRSPKVPVYAVFASRRGLLPAVRALLDHLAGDCAPYQR